MAADDVTLQVLTNTSLFRSIVAFSSGVSHFVYQIKQQLVCASEGFKEGDPVAREDVQLWQHAICAGDRRTLEALRVLSEANVLGERVRQVLRGITDFAFSHTTNLDLIEWIDPTFPHEVFDSLAGDDADIEIGEQGSVEIVQWILRRRYILSDNVAYGAASKGHVDLVKFCYESPAFTFDCAKAMRLAATNGCVPVVRMILEHVHESCTHGVHDAINDAAANGHLDVIKLLHEYSPGEVSSYAMDIAATNGYFDVVLFLHGNSAEGCSTDAMDGAAANGHLEIVKFLHCTMNDAGSSKAMDGAVLNRHLEVVKYLRRSCRVSCSSHAMADAVKNEQLETLQLLCRNRGEVSVKRALRAAARLGLVTYFKFLHEVSPESVAPGKDMVNHAASSGHLELLQYFHEHDQVFEFTPEAMHSAAIANELESVRFLHENRSEGCYVSTLLECDRLRLTRIVDFLCSRRPMADPARGIARANRVGRFVLAAKLERYAVTSTAQTAYEYA